jgi:predicted AAA+ superfamily ATPase
LNKYLILYCSGRAIHYTKLATESLKHDNVKDFIKYMEKANAFNEFVKNRVEGVKEYA